MWRSEKRVFKEGTSVTSIKREQAFQKEGSGVKAKASVT